MSNSEGQPRIGFSVTEEGYYCDVFHPPLDDEERRILETTDSVAPFTKRLTADGGSEVWVYRDYYFGVGDEDKRLPDFYKQLQLFAGLLPGRKLKQSPIRLGEKAVTAFRETEKQFVDGLRLSDFEDADQTVDPPLIKMSKRRKVSKQRA